TWQHIHRTNQESHVPGEQASFSYLAFWKLPLEAIKSPTAHPPSRPPPISPAGIKAKNLALGKPAYQSSVQPHEILGSANKAVDGDCNGNWSHGSCIRTRQEAQPWWYVDLGHSYNISTVVVKNSEDCYGELISIDRTNLAFRKPTYQSSIYPNMHGGPSDRAVDGDCHGVWTHGSCTHTKLERNPCCGIIQEASLGSINTIYCNNNRGRYISIHLPREEYLTVCEVEAYGS
ncbi:hypothetical protein L345_16538, partial [Ophiophagus hannah]